MADVRGEGIQAWMKLEYEQVFSQLRDRDERIVEITKLYMTVFVAAAGAIITLSGIKQVSEIYLPAGMISAVATIAGEMLLAWMVAFRGYFVQCARQLNALRGHYCNQLEEDKRRCILGFTDAKTPRFLDWGSAHTFILLVMGFVNAVAVGMAGFWIAQYMRLTSNLLCLSMAAGLLLLTFNYVYIYVRLNDLENRGGGGE